MPEVRAVLGANRAKLDMLRAAQLKSQRHSAAPPTALPSGLDDGGRHTAVPALDSQRDAGAFANPVYDQVCGQGGAMHLLDVWIASSGAT